MQFQKWHERYFILRANRTLECHKSKKSQKSPRRVVDLRECINLEVGLEYKNLQHVMSLGTFKRTFFYAAPSDPLMLQWADVLEKAKNAKDSKLLLFVFNSLWFSVATSCLEEWLGLGMLLC